MSRAQALQRTTKNPATIFIDVKCGDGEFRFYDSSKKADGYKGEKPVDTLKFALLDLDLFTITGYNESVKKGLYSNEVRTVNDILKVRYNGPDKKDILVGPYADIKGDIKEINGQYTRCVYGMLANGSICHIKISGAGLSAWFNQVESGSEKGTTHWVEVNEWVDKKKGRVDYKEPQFEFTDKLSQKELDKAEELYTIVQNYLKAYLANGGPVEKSTGVPKDVLEEVEEDDEAETVINTDNWKTYKFRNKDLYDLGYSRIQDYKDKFESDEDVESEDYQYLCRAIKEHQDATKNWKEFKTDKGTVLGKCDKEKLEGLLEQLIEKRPKHEVRIYIEAGIRELSATPEDDDEIPF